jgi:HEAT repeat protein
MLGDVTRMLDSLSTVITGALSAERHGEAAQLAAGIIATESTFSSDPDARRAFTLALKRLADWGLIRELANGLAKAGERRPQFIAVLTRYGDDAVDELLGRLVYADSVRERRILFDAIVQLGSGVRTMIQMLDDPRWYVVRNAADLLGRIGALAAEGPLVRALRHDEPRVRRSAALALARLGTPAAFSALRDALTDAAPGVRMHAVLALATRKDASSAAALTKVLDVETDPEVQQTIFTALGKIGTPGAVRRLIEAATNEGKMFRRTPIPFRVAALRALAEIQTPEAIAALQTLTSDKEREVRENAAKAIANRVTGAAPAEPSSPSEW